MNYEKLKMTYASNLDYAKDEWHKAKQNERAGEILSTVLNVLACLGIILVAVAFAPV